MSLICFCGKPPPRDRSADRSADHTRSPLKLLLFKCGRDDNAGVRRATPHVRCGASLLARRARHLADRSRENLRAPHLYKPSLLQPSCHTFVTDTVLLRSPMQVPRKSVDQAGRELRSARRRAHCATDSARPLLTIAPRPPRLSLPQCGACQQWSVLSGHGVHQWELW